VSDLLARSRAALIVTDKIDLAAAAAAVKLADLAGATLDHAQPTGLGPSQEQGTLGTAPGEAGLRADVVIVVGPVTEALKADPNFQRLTSEKPGRNVVALGSEAGSGLAGNAEKLNFGERPLNEQLGILLALAQGKPVALGDDGGSARDFVENRLQAAKYGVIVVAPDAVDPLSQFAAMSLCNILSAETRWTLLPLGRPEGQGELIRMCQALSGLPPPISFASAKPNYDPLIYRAPDFAGRGDCDAIVWISACEKALPQWVGQVPTAAITARPDAILADAAQVKIGRPGIDHDAMKEDEKTGFITVQAAASPSQLPSAAQVLEEIAGQLSAKITGAAA
jgi:formylmethanofuran dehydrogenase subunit B